MELDAFAFASSPIVELNILREYLQKVEDLLANEAMVHNESLEKLLSNPQIVHPEDNSPPPEAEYDIHHLGMLDQFKNQLRKSFFITLYSFLETQLKDMCHSRKSEHISLNISDLAGSNDIDRVKVFFKKVLLLNFPSDAPEWHAIQKYKLLRNWIVHNQSRLNDSYPKNKDLTEYAHNHKYLSIHYDEVCLEKGFCEEACQIIETFLLKVMRI